MREQGGELESAVPPPPQKKEAGVTLKAVEERLFHDQAKALELRAVVIDAVIALREKAQEQLDRYAKLLTEPPPVALVKAAVHLVQCRVQAHRRRIFLFRARKRNLAGARLNKNLISLIYLCSLPGSSRSSSTNDPPLCPIHVVLVQAEKLQNRTRQND
jgi:hypothetical protein